MGFRRWSQILPIHQWGDYDSMLPLLHELGFVHEVLLPGGFLKPSLWERADELGHRFNADWTFWRKGLDGFYYFQDADDALMARLIIP